MTVSFDPVPEDRRLATREIEAGGWLGRLCEAGWLEAADAHVARRLGVLVDEPDELVVVVLGLVVRAVREGSTCLEPEHALELLAAAADSGAGPEGGLPTSAELLERVAASRLVGCSVVQVEHGLLYLDRYWREEQQVAADLTARASTPTPAVDETLLEAGLARVFDGDSWEEQRAAVRAALSRPTTILTGGPGTGKTSTVAGLLALLDEQHRHRDPAGRPLRVVLAAPTGKAAARLRESVLEAGVRMSEQDRARLAGIDATTVHRLLGWTPSSTRFRRTRANPLPHDVVVVDEASMLPLTLTARLLEAVRPGARLVLVGDPDQLASVEAGAVLADLVAGYEDAARGDGSPLRSPVSALLTPHRYGSEIGALASGIRDGDAAAVLATLRAGSEAVRFVELPPGSHESENDAQLTRERTLTADTALRTGLLDHAMGIRAAAEEGDAETAVGLLRDHRLLCAHRDGPWGVATWNRRVEQWVTEQTHDPMYGERSVGEPLLVTRNDLGLGLFNGDSGVVVAGEDGRLVGAFDAAAGLLRHGVARLADVETAHAMTVHKSQGSQATRVTVLLPDEDSRLLTRELFYTAVTRAQEQVTVVGTQAAVLAAVTRRTRRASGLRHSLRAT